MDILTIALIVGVLAPFIYIEYRFLRTLRDVLRAVREQNRTMPPSHVWLNFIPLFNLAWIFVTLIGIRGSARAELAFRGLPKSRGDLGFRVGIAFGVLRILVEVFESFDRFTDDRAVVAMWIFKTTFGVASLVCWLMYWWESVRLKDLLISAVPVSGSPALPTPAGYRPPSWQLPQEARTIDSAQEGQLPEGDVAPWLGARRPPGSNEGDHV